MVSFREILLTATAAVVATASAVASVDPAIDLAATHLGVTVDHVQHLLASENYSDIDPTHWSATFQQPVDVIAAWPQDFKEHALSTIARMLHQGMEIAKRDNEAADYHYTNERSILDTEAMLREKTDDSGCNHFFSRCTACIGVATVAYIGAVAGCTSAGITAEAAAAPATAGAATAVIWLGYIKCVSAALAVYGTAAIGCHHL
ncbi:uncharacterized protein ColSpa_08932 [Colletotrichum spaethianum]|uniref:Uncharacterized protein n=1 Tax=Colletotrichum spaethianum TaxID=700344 RepID=A0AA37UJT5_9PEZI|nr:uncharacterized protein ColSpa_08932 [Colletotrichum spaethianum]GKT48751.1 hypothetical protein ColSpa_08932 [Colletotrichum spaethianum]